MLSGDFLACTITSYTPELKHSRLVRSAERHGWLPFFVEFTIPYGTLEYAAFLSKKHLFLKSLLEREKKFGKTHFLFLDAWDTVFIQPPDRFPMEWDRLSFGAEKNCYPEPKFAGIYPGLSPFPYLNSGCIWGPIDRYLALCPREEEHDQLAWTKAYLAAPEQFHLDHSAEVVLNLHSTAPSELSRWPGGSVQYVPTHSWPFILHGNGKWPLPNFLEV